MSDLVSYFYKDQLENFSQPIQSDVVRSQGRSPWAHWLDTLTEVLEIFVALSECPLVQLSKAQHCIRFVSFQRDKEMF